MKWKCIGLPEKGVSSELSLKFAYYRKTQKVGKEVRKMRMESSEEEDDFPSIESVTPQSKIDTIYQSKTEKVNNNYNQSPLTQQK